MVECKVYFDDNKFIVVNPETGESIDLVSPKKKSSTKKKTSKTDDNPNPIITLESNKYCLNNAAVELLKVEPGDRLVIRYIHGEPIIGKTETFKLGSDAGNKMTQSNTVSCRGKGNEELSKFGFEFNLVATETEGQYIMKGDAPELPSETEEIANPNSVDDLEDLIEIDSNEEVNPFSFTL